MKLNLLLLVLITAGTTLYSQENTENMAPTDSLPYYEIPDYPAEYTAETVAARMIDGLGFRYYWATEGLRPEDLAYKPNDEARNTEATIDHILSLSKVIVNATRKVPNVRGDNAEEVTLTFEEKRRATLENIKAASDILKSGTGRLEEYKIIFQNGDQRTEYPFWNELNGPIADALWHCGQVVSFRRSSGNPFSAKVSVFSGKVRE